MSDKKREHRPRKVENCQLQALLDEDDTRSQKMFAIDSPQPSWADFHASCH